MRCGVYRRREAGRIEGKVGGGRDVEYKEEVLIVCWVEREVSGG